MVPDEAMLSMLRREVLLTRAKLHYLGYQQMAAERMLRSLKAQLRQVGAAALGRAALRCAACCCNNWAGPHLWNTVGCRQARRALHACSRQAPQQRGAVRPRCACCAVLCRVSPSLTA